MFHWSLWLNIIQTLLDSWHLLRSTEGVIEIHKSCCVSLFLTSSLAIIFLLTLLEFSVIYCRFLFLWVKIYLLYSDVRDIQRTIQQINIMTAPEIWKYKVNRCIKRWRVRIQREPWAFERIELGRFLQTTFKICYNIIHLYNINTTLEFH